MVSAPIYIALIGDLVRSRRIEARRRSLLQSHLRAALQAANQRHAAGVASRLLLTLGDEFQGLFHPTPAGCAAVVELLRDLTLASAPTRVRFALGVGPLSTEPLPEAIGMDGPCFHRAREGLLGLKSDDLSCWLQHRGTTYERMWSLLASNATRQAQAWTPLQRDLIGRLSRPANAPEDGETTQKKVAAELGITESAVSQRLHAARWRLYQRSLEALRDGLRELVD